jgi:predicted nucleic-acid-binding protein
MVALDTNVFLRLVLDDDPEQTERARNLVAGTPCFVPLTVILESEWILRRVYSYSKSAMKRAFVRLTDIENIAIESEDIVNRALELNEQGIDFADALHLASSTQCDWFATFDKRFVKSAEDAAPPVRQP